MFDLLFSFDAWVALLTLTVLEIVLGIDNIIFLALVANRVAPEQRPLARRIGLFLALGLRIAFLSKIGMNSMSKAVSNESSTAMVLAVVVRVGLVRTEPSIR